MNRQRIITTVLCLFLALGALASPAEDLRVLPETIDGIKPADMMGHYLRGLARVQFDRWQTQYEQRKTPQQIVAYQQRMRGQFVELIGGLPERTSLNPQITGVIQRDGYKVEKVIFESQPKHYVTGALFIPASDRFTAPYPGVIEPVGHSFTAKAREIYQSVGALLALNGIVALVFDPIDQGERGQMLSQWPALSGTKAHTNLGVGSMLLGRNTARFEIWDGMRAIDYLQSRPEVDPARIGCAGLSGGGTQTSYLMALDERIQVAAPACYLTGFERLLATIGPQDAEQNIFGQLALGMDHADYLMMRAPKPTLICAATGDFFDISGTWDTYRHAKRLYSRMGFAERIDLIEHDGEHNYHKPLREATTRWMMRWLLGKDEPITEPPLDLLSEEEIQCTPDGQVMHLPGARSAYDLHRDYEKDLSRQRKILWATESPAQLLDRVRGIAGIRRLGELPQPKVVKLDVVEGSGYRIQKMIVKPEDGITLPALMFDTARQGLTPPTVLYIREDGKNNTRTESDETLDGLIQAGKRVLAVDLRGIGETRPTGQGTLTGATGPDWKDVFTAYLLQRSYVGMRAEDVLVCVRWLKREYGAQVEVVAHGNVGVPVLHAAALEPDLFASVKLVRTLSAWSTIIELGLSANQQVNAVHGALTTYDLPDLARTLGDKLITKEPLDALGQPVEMR